MTFSPLISAAGAGPAQEPAPGQPAQPGPGPGPGEDGYAGPAPGPDQDGSAAATGDPPGQDAAETGTQPGQDGYAAAEASHAAGPEPDADPEAPWPHQSFLELGALPTAAPCARLHTSLVLREWRLDPLVQTATLVVAELVSNAVQASLALTGSRFAGVWAPGKPPVRLWLSADEHRVVVQVWDGSDRPPVPQPVAPEADNGRGLLLVGALAAEWGCYTPDKSSGKVVWAVVGG